MTEQKHILHIINGEFYSGAERVQDLLGLQLPKYGYLTSFICLKKGAFEANCHISSENIHILPMRHKFDLNVIFAISRYIKKKRPLLIHSHTPRSALIAAICSKITGRPQVHHLHSPTTACTENSFRNLVNSLVENKTMASAKKIIAVSPSLRDYLIKRGINKERVSVIPNGVPIMPSLTDKACNFENLTIGVMALFRPRKGIEILLHALELLKNRGYKFRLRAIGTFETTEYEQKIKAMATQLGLSSMIDWVGFRQDIQAEFSLLDLFILPSLAGEGTPMVILEAMSYGVPIIATKVEGIPDVIRTDLDGLLVSPGNVAALSEAVEKIITKKSDWGNIRQNAYQHQTAEYSDIRMAEDVAAVYDSILSHPEE